MKIRHKYYVPKWREFFWIIFWFAGGKMIDAGCALSRIGGRVLGRGIEIRYAREFKKVRTGEK